MRGILCTLALVIIVAPVLLGQPPEVSRRRLDSLAMRDGIYRLDTSHIDVTVGGRDYSARSIAYISGGQLFIKGFWQADPSAKTGSESILSFCLLRVPGIVGEYRVAVDTAQRRHEGADDFQRQSDTSRSVLFSALFSGPSKGRAYAIYQSDYNGGSGTVTITSMGDGMIRGTFTMTAVNDRDHAETRQVSGRFEVPLRRWMDDYWITQR